MTYSLTASSTFTITDARYVASKMGADLRGLYARYSKPSADDIDQYIEEAAQCLKAGYLKTVDFGFKQADLWVLRLRYTAISGGQLSDSAPGRLPAASQVAGCGFYSYLTWSDGFLSLPATERQAFRATLPITRTSADAPSLGSGRHGNSAEYSRHGAGLNRDVYSAF
ncbi:HORMA-1 domain-containing protein [Mycolicibacterium gilvum]|uniref:HORMA-1 domain-containing protein n=1 Tax=Mycolicibacterium gilvum TaxID=1804 RepID=UPI0040459396